MRVMVLVKATTDSEAGIMPSLDLLTAMGEFNMELAKAGILLAGEGLHEMGPSAQDARSTVRRADHVRAHGVYAAIDSVTHSGYGRDRRERNNVTWHCDPDCPDAAGKDREDHTNWAAYTTGSVIDILIGRTEVHGQQPFCRRCIYLEDEATS